MFKVCKASCCIAPRKTVLERDVVCYIRSSLRSFFSRPLFSGSPFSPDSPWREEVFAFMFVYKIFSLRRGLGGL